MTTRSILITGCSSGIGHDAAHGLKARGWRVFAACRQEADCESLRAAGFDSPRLDYSDPASIEAALNPADTEYIYFVAKTLDPRDGHNFAVTLDEHNRNVAAYRALEAQRDQ